MKIFIAVDMEGATGVVHPDQLTADGRGYQQAQQFLVDDINAVIHGVRRVYPQATFTVGDGHATMRNVLLEKLHPAAELVVGPATSANKPLCQLEGIQFGADLAMCVGYHTMAGTSGGLLAHTFIGSLISDLRMNGQSVGEVEVNAAILGAYGIPLALVAGNSDLETELRRWNTQSIFVSTKTTLGPTAALCKSPQVTSKLLSDAAEKAVRDSQYWYKAPIGATRFEVYTKHPEQTARVLNIDGVEGISESAFAVQGADASQAFMKTWSACLRALGELPVWLR